MAFQTACILRTADGGGREARYGEGSALTPALDNAIEGIAGIRFESARASGDASGVVDNGRSASNEGGGFKIKGIFIPLAVRSKQTHTQAEVDGKFLGDPPVVLEIGLENLVAVVIL